LLFCLACSLAAGSADARDFGYEKFADVINRSTAANAALSFSNADAADTAQDRRRDIGHLNFAVGMEGTAVLSRACGSIL
jgi:hypothetical protein